MVTNLATYFPNRWLIQRNDYGSTTAQFQQAQSMVNTEKHGKTMVEVQGTRFLTPKKTDEKYGIFGYLNDMFVYIRKCD